MVCSLIEKRLYNLSHIWYVKELKVEYITMDDESIVCTYRMKLWQIMNWVLPDYKIEEFKIKFKIYRIDSVLAQFYPNIPYNVLTKSLMKQISLLLTLKKYE